MKVVAVFYRRLGPLKMFKVLPIERLRKFPISIVAKQVYFQFSAVILCVAGSTAATEDHTYQI